MGSIRDMFRLPLVDRLNSVCKELGVFESTRILWQYHANYPTITQALEEIEKNPDLKDKVLVGSVLEKHGFDPEEFSNIVIFNTSESMATAYGLLECDANGKFRSNASKEIWLMALSSIFSVLPEDHFKCGQQIIEAARDDNWGIVRSAAYQANRRFEMRSGANS